MLTTLILLYWTFFKVGLFTFGGGYAAIPLMEAELITGQGWMTASEFLDIIAVAEMTPGPVAINAATFVGFRMAGIGGALLATLGVITPALVLLLLLGRFLMRWIRDPRIESFLMGLRPAFIALILLAAFTLGREALVDLQTILIAAGLLAAGLLRQVDPIYLILAGAVLGLILFQY